MTIAREQRKTGKPLLRAGLALAALILLALVALIGWPQASLESTARIHEAALTLDPGDRILVLAPHPDDETLAAGGVIQKAVEMGLPVQVVFLTNGDANEWSFVLYRRRPELLPGQVEAMGEVRQGEALAAAKVLGLRPDQLTFLGYPDFGTLRIWESHWGSQPPLRSLFTRVTQVPYGNAYRTGAAYKGEEILKDLESVIKDYTAVHGAPTKVFVSHPADANPDHEALYAFTRVALWDLGISPDVYPYLVHTPGWPMPRGLAPNVTLSPPAGLADQGTWWTSPLTNAENERKLSALKAHRTQYDSNTRYLSSFIRANELFNELPDTALQGANAETRLETSGPAAAIPPELTEEQRAKFVGIEWRTVRRDGDNLILTLALSKPLAEGVGVSAYLFGYRSDKPFASMPKIHVQVGALSQTVYDQSRRLDNTGAQVSRTPREIELSVPLALLGDPDRALVAARTYLGDMPLDSAGWTVFEFRPE